MVNINIDEFFSFHNSVVTREHQYKLYKKRTVSHVRLGGVMVTASGVRSTGSRVRLPAVPLPSSNRGPVALCTLGLGLLNPPPLNGR